jgi:cellulose synthase/poly-beta-1,6-N-acetylglucosamine synthase-like glycosyltransferase
MIALAETALAIQSAFAAFAVLNSLFWRDLEPRATPTDARVSVLIPARNEARNLERLLPSLMACPLPNLEVIVLDDRSEDETAAVVQRFASLDPRVRLERGAALPDGWLGKNWACHQLSQAATGDVLAFTDADTAWHAGAPAAIAQVLETCDALCAWPRQAVTDPVSRLLQPLQQWSLVAFLPLALVPVRRFAVAVAANGQCLAFTRAAYARIGGHAAVRMDVLEDMALARGVKRARLRFGLYNGAQAITTQMYQNSREAVQGYAKNVYPAFGGTPLAFFGAAGFNLALGVAPWVWALMTWQWQAWLCVALSLVARGISDARCRYDLRFTALHPLGLLLWAGVGVLSMRRFQRGEVAWKGRSYDLRRGDRQPDGD